MSDNSSPSLDTLVSLAKRRGLVFPASEIYGGIAGFYDYGPYGSQMARNIKDAWWDAFVRSAPNIFGIDSAIIQNSKLWQASGHVDGFNDPMVECNNCHSRHRVDHLIGKEMEELVDYVPHLKDAACNVCGTKGDFGEVKTFNMMFKTHVGAAEDSDSIAYLRPETAGGIFTNFELVRESARAKLPFGIAQIGKAFRNEISPREFVFRVREFEQMELEYFVYPEAAEKEYETMKQFCWDWLKEVGLNEEFMEWHQHDEAERAHYAADSWDINYAFPHGSKELWGIANRTDYDLKAHSQASGKDLSYFDSEENEHIVPYVIEPSIGVSRLFLAMIHSAYTEETVNDETRVVLKLKPGIAPVDVAILPLSKKPELSNMAKELYEQLVGSTDLTVEYDETQSIGKRYRRQDEIGTPKCITVDFESLEDKAATIRDRDSMEQKRVPVEELVQSLATTD
ncbi:MAG: glycine--tRNA ligase [Candidatus Saccharimonadales bacterium]|nr:glycine--tRNA ligase [Candidatus Saccharimonadales bacterium]